MRWLITGGTGLIGQNLARILAERGDEIHIFSRDPDKAKLFQGDSIRFFTGDIRNPGTLLPAMEGCNGVFHLAAYARSWAKDNRVFFDYNVSGTRNILDAAILSGIQRIVIASTAGVLGPAVNGPKTEAGGPAGPFYTLYEESKYKAEKTALDYAADKRIEVIITYPTPVSYTHLTLPTN